MMQKPDKDNTAGSKKKNQIFTKVHWPIRFAFLTVLILGSRQFLGFKLRAIGFLDIVTSISTMLVLILLAERFLRGITRKIVLFLLCGLMIFFHLVSGVYYRFFNALLPFDIINQWKDLFYISDEGASLISLWEMAVAVYIPTVLLVLILVKPLRVKWPVFATLFLIASVGWAYRLSCPLQRGPDEIAALPRYFHWYGHCRGNLLLDKQRYHNIVKNIDAVLPRNLDGYKRVNGKGIMLKPVSSLIAHRSSLESGPIFRTQSPVTSHEPLKYNIIFILMESVRAYECGFLGAKPSFTPGLDKLAGKARLFDNFYANGSQTVRGEFSSLCSIYPNPIGVPTYIVRPNLDVISLPQILRNLGYETVWFSAYTADFHNKRQFLTAHGIGRIIDKDILPEPNEPIIADGMNDVEMFDNTFKVLMDCNQPFFAQITTLSNHYCCYDYPTNDQAPIVEASPEYRRYAHGIYYTDYAVSGFIEKILESKLADNTIIIITGDHGLWLFPPGVADPLQKREMYFRLPLCIWGPPDVITPGIDHTLGSQLDIAPTLMEILKISADNTFLGQSLINTNIAPSQRYVVTFLGCRSAIRIADMFTIRSNTSSRIIRKFATIEGDVLRGKYNVKHYLGTDDQNRLRKKLDNIKFFIGYCIYHNAFKGLK